MTPPFRLEALDNAHDRSAFVCGEEALDRYFRTQVSQDTRRHIANCFVAVDNTNREIAGYYTISSTCIPTPDLPLEMAKRLPRYPVIPAVRIGRLAVGLQFQGRGLGAALLADAARRTLVAGPASFALVVDAKNGKATAFYKHHGFIQFSDKPESLFLPIATAAKVLLPPSTS